MENFNPWSSEESATPTPVDNPHFSISPSNEDVGSPTTSASSMSFAASLPLGQDHVLPSWDDQRISADFDSPKISPISNVLHTTQLSSATTSIWDHQPSSLSPASPVFQTDIKLAQTESFPQLQDAVNDNSTNSPSFLPQPVRLPTAIPSKSDENWNFDHMPHQVEESNSQEQVSSSLGKLGLEFDPLSDNISPPPLSTYASPLDKKDIKHSEKSTAFLDIGLAGRVNASIVSDPVNDKESAIFAIFVARFDTLRGNIIEFQYPPEMDLRGLEFTLLPPGSHTVGTDVIYFTFGAFFGVAVFKREMVLDSGVPGVAQTIAANERGARAEIYILSEEAILSDALLAYYHIINDGGKLPVPHDPHALEAIQPISHLTSFVIKMGPAIFSIWKYALLRGRIMFFSPPPVRNSCISVFCTSLITQHDTPQYDNSQNMLFFCNVNDIPKLEKHRLLPGSAKPPGYDQGFVSCTSDAIFETKGDLWDVYIKKDGELVFPKSVPLYNRFQTNPCDKAKWNYLMALVDRSEGAETVENALYMRRSEEKTGLLDDVDNLSGQYDVASISTNKSKTKESDHQKAALRIIGYFHHLNTRLLSTFLLLSHSPTDTTLSWSDIRNLDLDPEYDRMFLLKLSESMHVDLIISEEDELVKSDMQRASALAGSVGMAVTQLGNNISKRWRGSGDRLKYT